MTVRFPRASPALPHAPEDRVCAGSSGPPFPPGAVGDSAPGGACRSNNREPGRLRRNRPVVAVDDVDDTVEVEIGRRNGASGTPTSGSSWPADTTPPSTTRTSGLAGSEWDPKTRRKGRGPSRGNGSSRMKKTGMSDGSSGGYVPVSPARRVVLSKVWVIRTLPGLSSADTHRDSRVTLSSKRTGVRATSAFLVRGHTTERPPRAVWRSVISLNRSSFVSIS